METYKHSRSSVGSNRKHVQITPKYRYKMMRQEKLKVFCKVAIEEACKKHKIEIEIINVQTDHVHMVVDCPRMMCDAKMMQIIKGLSSYFLFRICPNLRKRYPQGRFWNAGYFCDGVGNSDFERACSYVENQQMHHASQ
ncbi:MAG: IS200/IS605 family transposase [Nanoarchaeota archaeon]|nr:IS200/IS605 family transposase [Nanoarchaeota archaeon]